MWSTRNLGDGMLAAQPLGQIEQHFLDFYTTAGSPTEMAVFIRHESDGRLHCEVKLYFSPAAHEVAQELGAEPCVAPSKDNLGLLIGADDCWSALFPEVL